MFIVNRNPSPAVLRNFALLWLLFFSAASAWRFLWKDSPKSAMCLLAVALVAGIPGLAQPRLLRPIFVGWMTLTRPIGWVVSQLILATLLFAILTPLALIQRVAGRDFLRLRRKRCASYWSAKPGDFEPARYLRPF